MNQFRSICFLLATGLFLQAPVSAQTPPLVLTVGVADANQLQQIGHENILALVETSAQRDALRKASPNISVGLASDWQLANWAPRLVDILVIGDPALCPPEVAENLVADGGSIHLPLSELAGYASRPLLQREGNVLKKLATPGLDDWPMMRRDPGRSGFSRDQFAGPPQAPRWMAGEQYGEIPTLAAEGLLITREEIDRGPEFLFRTRSAFNGRLLWETTAELHDPERIKGHPIGERGKLGGRGDLLGVFARDGILYVRGEQKIRRFDLATGKEAGAFDATDALWLTPLNAGILIVGNETTRLVDPITGQPRWSIRGDYRRPVCNDNTVVLLQVFKDRPAGSILTALDAKNGTPLWAKPLADLSDPDIRSITSQGEILVFGQRNPAEFSAKDRGKESPLVQLQTISLETGRALWQSEALEPSKNLIRMITEVDGTFYMVGSYDGKSGLKEDPRVKRYRVRSVNIGCQLAASTPHYLLFKDHGGTDLEGNHFAAPETFTLGKSVCGQQYIPAYGQSFITSQPCDCRTAGAWLRAGVPTPKDDPLLAQFFDPLTTTADTVGQFPVENGPADAGKILAANPYTPSGWAHARGDAGRSGTIASPAPVNPSAVWKNAALNARPSMHPGYPSVSGPVTAGDLVAVSLCESGAVVGLDRQTGRERWRWQGDSRIPSPPVIHRGLVLAGQQSGHIVALDASTGQLAWRTRVAPGVRVLVDHGRISSMWPVNSPLTARGDRVYGIAGLYFHWANTPRVFAIDLATGQVAWTQIARVNGRLLEATEQGLLPTRETDSGARWFGGIAVGHFDYDTGVFNSLPRSRGNPATPAASPLFSWRESVSPRHLEKGFTFDPGTSLTYADGIVRYDHEAAQNWKTKVITHTYTLKAGDQTIPLDAGVVPLGLAGDAQGLVITCEDGSVRSMR